MRSKLVLLFVLLSVVAAACGGETEPLTTSTAVIEPSSVTSIADQPDGTPIGPDGGTVTSADGLFTVEIPAGALSETTSIAIEVVAATDVGLNGSLFDGPIYQLLPDGLTFEVPVTTVRQLSVSDLGIPDDAVPFFHVFQGLGDDWEALSTETSRDGELLIVRAETTHFSLNVAVESTRVWDREVTMTLAPASFSASVGTSRTTVSNLELGPDLVTKGGWILSDNLFGGALAGYTGKFYTGGPVESVATCGDVAGEGLYLFRYGGSVGLESPEALFLGVASEFQMKVLNKPFTVSAVGKATCTKPDLSLLSAVLGIASGQIDFQLHEDSPPGSEYTAGFEIEIDPSARKVKKTQKPSNQKTEGPIDPVTGIYFTSAETDSYFEAYVGGVCPETGGPYYVGGYTFGGPPSMADDFQAFLDSIPGFNAAVSTPQSISVDPALVPSCEGLDSDPWAFANAIRSFFGPSGSIPNAQWYLIFTGELEAGG